MALTPDSEIHAVDSPDELRHRASSQAAQAKVGPPVSAPSPEVLVEELRIHQIELEMQNEELRRVQADLELSRARYFDLYDLAPVGYVTVNPDGLIAEANLRTTTLFGVHRSALLRRRLTRFIAVDSQDTYHLTRNRLLQSGQSQICELRMVRPNAPSFLARLELSLAEEGGVQVCRIVIVDINDRQILEEALRQANAQLIVEKTLAEEATRAKSQFLSAMSHEIRTPLNGVIGMAGLLLQTHMNPEQQGYARIVADSAEALLGLVNNILDFSKIEAGRVELEETSFDLECLIEDVLDIMSFKAREKSLELACWYPASMPRHFAGDAGRIRQIVMNFVSNSIKFTHVGYVLVEVECGAPVDGKCTIRLHIHDTGIGIAEQNLKHLFNRFRQADSTISRLYGGTGLGLAIVRQLVELMGGEIGVNSMEGEGSTFSCTLPLKLEAEPSLPPTNSGALAGLSILVSGTQQIARFVIGEWCQRWNMNVEKCELVNLIRHLSEARQRGRSFDLLLVDAGVIALRESVAAFHSSVQSPTPKLILLTSDSLDKTIDLVADAILPTPVRAKILGAKLSELANPSGQPPLVTYKADCSKDQVSAQPAFRVLVTDDNLVNQKLATVLLSKLGCIVDTADSGADAVSKVCSTDYALVLMDCVMPGMDGFAATTAIRNLAGKCSGVPIVALTASATSEDRDHCLAVGMNGFLTKPVRSEDLASCLAKWIRN